MQIALVFFLIFVSWTVQPTCRMCSAVTILKLL